MNALNGGGEEGRGLLWMRGGNKGALESGWESDPEA